MRKWIAAMAVIMVILLLWYHQAASNPEKSVPDNAISVTTITAEPSKQERQLALSGQVIGREEVPVYAESGPGKILEVLVDEGDHVKAGQRLASIDTALLRVQRTQQLAIQQKAVVAFNQAEAALEEAKLQSLQASSEKQRGDKVAEDGLISREVAEQRATAEKLASSRVKAAQNGLSMALADLSLANAQLAEIDLKSRRAELTAPVAGTVIERKAVTGASLAQASDPLFIIQRDDNLEIELEVSGDEVRMLHAGMPVTITLNGDATQYPGKIRRKAGHISRDQTAKLRVGFNQVPLQINGQIAKVTVRLPAKQGLYIPESAVYTEGNTTYVYTINHNKALRVPVTLGAHYDGLVEVAQGLSSGTAIVDKFANFLHDGETVHVVATPSKAAQ